jgi:uncharacterized repeat protein (TIGR04076 family)
VWKNPEFKHVFCRQSADDTIIMQSNEAEVKMPNVIAKVISQKGLCHAQYRVGDEFVVSGKTPPNHCAAAYCSLFPYIRVLEFGGTFPWEKDKDKAIVACPDPENPVVFELRRTQP